MRRWVFAGVVLGAAIAAPVGPVAAADDCCKAALAPPAAAATTAVLAAAALVDHRGRSVSLPDGRPWVLTFFYGHCPDVCPTMIYNVADVASALPAAVRQKVGFGAISFDHARDTVPRLAEYAENFELRGDHHYLMTGEPQTLARVFTAFKFDYKPDRNGGYQHTTLTAVMDGQGRILHHFYGLRPDIERIAVIVKDLAGG